MIFDDLSYSQQNDIYKSKRLIEVLRKFSKYHYEPDAGEPIFNHAWITFKIPYKDLVRMKKQKLIKSFNIELSKDKDYKILNIIFNNDSILTKKEKLKLII